MLYVWLISWAVIAVLISIKTKSKVSIIGGGFIASLIVVIIFASMIGQKDNGKNDIKQIEKKEKINSKPMPLNLKYENYEKVVNTSFNSSIQENVELSDNQLTVIIKEPEIKGFENYFTSGDKTNKILAIESVRLFYKIPELEILNLTLRLNSGTYQLKIAKSQLEKYYRIKIDQLREYWDNGQLKIGDKWRTQFLSRYDSKESRRKFVNQFVSITK